MFRHLAAGLFLLAVTDSSPFFARRGGAGCTANCTFTGTTSAATINTTTISDQGSGLSVTAGSTQSLTLGADANNSSITISGAGGATPISFNAGAIAQSGLTVSSGLSTDTSSVSSSLTLGSGSGILHKLSSGTTTSPAAQAATSCSDVAVTVTGAATGDFCWVAAPSGAMGSLQFTAYVTATNTAQLHKCNVTAGSLTPATGTYTIWCGH